MPRNKFSLSSKSESRFKWDVFLELTDDDKDFPSQSFNSASREVYLIQVLNLITVIYGFSLIYYIINDEHYMYIGSWKSLFIPLIHGILEYIKFQIYQRSTVKKFPMLMASESTSFLPVYLTVILLIHYFAVMFGAEIIENIESTAVFSCFLATLLLFPTYFYCGKHSIHVLTFRKKPITLMHLSLRSIAMSSALGAWFGAFVIPLDWDRSWQQWPIPCVIGSLTGFVLGHLYSFLTLFLLKVKGFQ